LDGQAHGGTLFDLRLGLRERFLLSHHRLEAYGWCSPLFPARPGIRAAVVSSAPASVAAAKVSTAIDSADFAQILSPASRASSSPHIRVGIRSRADVIHARHRARHIHCWQPLFEKTHCVMAITADTAGVDIYFHREQGQSPSQTEGKSHVRMHGAEEYRGI